MAHIPPPDVTCLAASASLLTSADPGPQTLLSSQPPALHRLPPPPGAPRQPHSLRQLPFLGGRCSHPLPRVPHSSLGFRATVRGLVYGSRHTSLFGNNHGYRSRSQKEASRKGARPPAPPCGSPRGHRPHPDFRLALRRPRVIAGGAKGGGARTELKLKAPIGCAAGGDRARPPRDVRTPRSGRRSVRKTRTRRVASSARPCCCRLGPPLRSAGGERLRWV